jgi:hypothetical protein
MLEQFIIALLDSKGIEYVVANYIELRKQYYETQYVLNTTKTTNEVV